MRLLLVEDDPVLSDVMQRSLNQHGHRVDSACTLEDGRHWWRVQPFDAVLLDLNLPASAPPPTGRRNWPTAWSCCARRVRGGTAPP